MSKFFTYCFVDENLDQHDSNEPIDTITSLLKLSKEIISDHIIPYFDEKTIISFAGVCSEWRRIVKTTKVKGVQCFSVHYSASNFMFQSLNEMSGLIKGDLNEIFSEFFIHGKVGNKNVTFERSVFKRLFNSKKVESLTLESTNIITKDIPSKHCSTLTNLKLINVEVSEENLRILCTRLERLTELTLIGNNIGKRAGLILSNSKLKNLTHLTIGNGVGNEGAEFLLTSDKLRNLKKREFVEIAGPYIDGSVKHVPRIDSSKFPSLCCFTSRRHLLCKEGIMNVLNSGIPWKELSLISCETLDDDCLLHISKITSIEKLCLAEPFDGRTSCLKAYKYLSSLQNMTHLEIRSDNDGLLELCNMKTNNLKHFCNYRSQTTSEVSEYAIQKFCDTFLNLTFLKFYNNNLGSGCMCHISKLPNLIDLQLDRTNVNMKDIKYISRMNHLKSLVFGSPISCEGMRDICDGSLINLTTLIFTYSSNARKFEEIDGSYLSTSNFPKLTYLSISNGLFAMNNFLVNLASGSSLKHLKHLELLTDLFHEQTLLDIVNHLCPRYLTIYRNYALNYEELRKKITSSTKIIFYEEFQSDKFISLQ
nr:unnamed protein product [Naegleria fowleri]